MPKNSDFIISTLIVVLFQNFSCIAWPQAATSRAAPPALRSRHVLMMLPAPWKATTHKRIQQKGQANQPPAHQLDPGHQCGGLGPHHFMLQGRAHGGRTLLPCHAVQGPGSLGTLITTFWSAPTATRLPSWELFGLSPQLFGLKPTP